MSIPVDHNKVVIGIEEDTLSSNSCASCGSVDIIYKNFPCRCLSYCKKCAMKLATGGKCKSCHQLFTSMSSFAKEKA